MKKYGGQLVYSGRDEYGPIEVVEFHKRSRSLHFGNRTQQSGMFLFNPIFLIHKYTQAMLTPLSWMQPKKALILGLGAGSIAKYLLYYLDDIVVDAIELRSSVIDIAKEYFSLPDISPRFKIHQTSAADYLKKSMSSTELFDLIIVDLFITTNEKDISVDVSEYYSLLGDMLPDHGCLCINLLGCDYSNYSGLDNLLSAFNYYVYTVPVDASNTILFATKQPIPEAEAIIDFSGMEKKYGLPFRQYFNKISLA